MPARHDFTAIQAQYPLLEEVQRHVKMKRVGREWAGLCPFHLEKTPSFMVNEAKGKFKCQGCGAHGDVIDFVQAIHSFDTKSEAINALTGGKVVTISEPVRQERNKLAEQREAEERDRKERGTAQAATRWERAIRADAGHPYLIRKGIGELVEDLAIARREGQSLLFPMYDADGEIMSVQAIDADGGKLFHSGAPVGGARMHIGIHMGRSIICEGVATGVSIYNAMPDQVVVTFSAGNMDKVARQFAANGVPIVLAPDVDQAAHFQALGAELDCPVILPVTKVAKGDFNDQQQEAGSEAVARTLLDGLAAFARRKEEAAKHEERESGPLDLWARTAAPSFPEHLLPPLIARFSKIRGEMVGCDPSGLAVAALASCGVMIRDTIRLKMKRHDPTWFEEARLWVMLVGDPSRKKTPIIRSATSHISKLDIGLMAEHKREQQDWLEAGKNGAPPVPHRLRISDITMESAAEVCAHNPDGVLGLQDELSGWFGGIEKYSGGKGGAKDRAFWLQAFNGSGYAIDRVGRKAEYVDNLSVSIVGGVQPDPIRRIMAESSDDGLIQRFLPIMLGEPSHDVDIEMPDVVQEYEAILDKLWALKPPQSFLGVQPVEFSDEAQELRSALSRQHLDMMSTMESVNRKVASHIGKYDGLFGRLALIFHCIEHVTDKPEEPLPSVLTFATAKRAADFLHRFLRRHALAFYTNVAGLTDDHEIIADVAGFILSHRLEKVTLRTLARGSTKMRRLTQFEGRAIFEQMVAFGWLEEASLRSDTTAWIVNDAVHSAFEGRAESERQRREAARQSIIGMLEE